MIVRACGLPAMPTRFRTVELDVKHTASKPPVLIISRVVAGGGAARTVRYAVTTASKLPLLMASRMWAAGGAARTVRYAVTSSTSQPMSWSPATSVSVAMSARGSRTRFTGSKMLS